MKSIGKKLRHFYYHRHYARMEKTFKGLQMKTRPASYIEIEMDPSSTLQIGEKFAFRPGCSLRVRENAQLIIGNNVNLSDYTIVTCREKIVMGNNIMFGPHTIIFDNDHNYKSDDYMHNYITQPIIIEDNVWIGAHVSILRGAHIKRGAVIGAGAVVKGTVEENTVLVARQELIQKRYK